MDYNGLLWQKTINFRAKTSELYSNKNRFLLNYRKEWQYNSFCGLILTFVMVYNQGRI